MHRATNHLLTITAVLICSYAATADTIPPSWWTDDALTAGSERASQLPGFRNDGEQAQDDYRWQADLCGASKWGLNAVAEPAESPESFEFLLPEIEPGEPWSLALLVANTAQRPIGPPLSPAEPEAISLPNVSTLAVQIVSR